ncbi:MAG TPA: DUF3488 and transglutaminase-like domain-containing protein [Actinomycetota bacterium]|nr:DUF3488 and transglutaminase-like domain-containing protein [Actinomycetota bacterium]
MARGTDPTPGRQRLLGLAAVAGLAAATAFAFGRLFTGRVPTLQLIAAALASVAVAALFERRGLVVATLASLVGLALAITWIVLPQTAWYGLPSMRTLRALGRSLELVGQQTRVRVAPTAALPPLMLATLTAVWTASFSAHALAIRAGSPLLAVLPMVALVGFADTVLQDGARPIYAVLFLGAALAVVFSDGLRRIRQWGPVWSTTRSSRIRASVKGSRAVAALVILAAILVPGLLPGFRAEALVDFSTGDEGGFGLDPFVEIKAQLDDQEPVDLFQVRAEEPAYWRMYAVDTFDGSDWTSSDPDASERGLVLSSPAVLPGSEALPDDAPRLPQGYTLLRGTETARLPMAYPAESITLPSGELTYDPVDSQALVRGGLGEGFEYSVLSRIVSPAPEQLDDVVFLTAEQYGRYTHVPSTIDPRIGELAEEWTRDEITPYRKILAIQEHLVSEYVWDTDVGAEANADVLAAMLFETRQGFCVQFATAMTLMVRELGYPARAAGGYRSGTFADGVFTVQTKDAHLWVEVLFPGYGWLAFEPSPSRPSPLAEPGTYLNPIEPAEGGPLGGAQQNENALGGGADAGCQVGPGGRPLPGQLCNAEERPTRLGADQLPPGLLDGFGEVAQEDEGGYSIPYRWIVIGLLAALAVLLVVVPIVKSAWRRTLLRRHREPRDRILAAYRVFDGEATDLGLGRRDGETLEEHRVRLAATVAFSDGHLGRLASATGHAAYGSSPPTSEQAHEVAEDARKAIRDLRRDAGWLRRAVGTYRPGI